MKAAEITDDAGRYLLEMLDAAVNGRLKALYAIGYDVLLTNANMHATRKALEDFHASLTPDGLVQSRAPASEPKKLTSVR